MEGTPYLISFHVNFKEDVFGLKEFNIAQKLNLILVNEDKNCLSYKNKIQSKNSDSRYSSLKHLSKCNYLHFYHHRCDLKLINNVTTSVRFFQDNIHERNDFAAKFSIYTFPDPRPFKYYNYFDFFNFFEFYQTKKTDYALDVGRAFHGYLSQADTEIFTIFEEFTDKNGKCKGVVDYRFIF